MTHLVLTELPPGDPAPTLVAALEHQAQIVLRGHPDVPGLLRSHLLDPDTITLDTARLLVAKEHHYKDWSDVLAHGDVVIDPRFEAAADAVIDGKLDVLERLLAETPELVRARSAYPHRTMLIHHPAQNGFEHTRQWTSPPNAPAIARALLAAGADPEATCGIYRGGPGTTPLSLLVTSGPPAIAKVQGPLVEVLCAGGANPDGIADDRPLMAAIVFGYTDAAEALARCGARVDNAIFAAALGDVALTEQFLAAPTALTIGPDGPPLPAEHMLEYALIYAAEHDRVEVVERLLARGPDLSIKEPFWQATALGIARHQKAQRVVDLLSSAAART